MGCVEAQRKNLLRKAIFLMAALLNSTGSPAQDRSFTAGLVSGCIDAQEKAVSRPLTREEKRSVLNFCYCRSAGISALAPDQESKKKLLLQDPLVMAAISRIDQSCLDGVNAGRTYYPKPK